MFLLLETLILLLLVLQVGNVERSIMLEVIIGFKSFRQVHKQALIILIIKIVSLGRQEPKLAGTTKWATTYRFRKTTSVVRGIQYPKMLSGVRFAGHDFLQVVFIF